MLCQAYEIHFDVASALRSMSQIGSAVWGLAQSNAGVLSKVSGALNVFSRLRLTHTRRDCAIDAVTLAVETVAMQDDDVLDLPFVHLLHFKKHQGAALQNQPKDLLMAPLSMPFTPWCF